MPLIPVDSEHSAVFQALQAGRREEVPSMPGVARLSIDLLLEAVESGGFGLYESFRVADLDGDGDIDAFHRDPGSGLRTLLNDDSGQLTETWTRADTNVHRGGVALVDLDADGDLDALIGSNTGTSGAGQVWLNDGEGWVEPMDWDRYALRPVVGRTPIITRGLPALGVHHVRALHGLGPVVRLPDRAAGGRGVGVEPVDLVRDGDGVAGELDLALRLDEREPGLGHLAGEGQARRVVVGLRRPQLVHRRLLAGLAQARQHARDERDPLLVREGLSGNADDHWLNLPGVARHPSVTEIT